MKISMIIPVYNVERYLEKCLESIICQMDERIEIILVDDGSPDSCPQICDMYATRYANIRVVHKKNGGLASAIKIGTQCATGTHVAYLDSDDWLEDGWFNDITEVLGKYPDIDAIFYGFHRVENNVKKVGIQYSLFDSGYYCNENIDVIKKNYMRTGGIGPTRWNKIYNRRIVMECLKYYDTRISIGEDMIFSSICVDMMRDVYILKQNYVAYNINTNSMTQHFNKEYEKSFEVLFQSLYRYFGDDSIVYYIHYINMRTMVNSLGKSDYKGKKRYLKKILLNNHERLLKVKNSDLKIRDIFLKYLMLNQKSLVLLGVAYAYRLCKNRQG